ncbi:MAG: DUF167 domain-containing protein [Burkholderiales bacterium]
MIQVKVKPQSRASTLTRLEDGTYLAQIKAPPVDGQANAELLALVARELGCAKSKLRIKVGGAARLKWVVVNDE